MSERRLESTMGYAIAGATAAVCVAACAVYYYGIHEPAVKTHRRIIQSIEESKDVEELKGELRSWSEDEWYYNYFSQEDRDMLQSEYGIISKPKESSRDIITRPLYDALSSELQDRLQVTYTDLEEKESYERIDRACGR
jgi:hypothetical protein